MIRGRSRSQKWESLGDDKSFLVSLSLGKQFWADNACPSDAMLSGIHVDTSAFKNTIRRGISTSADNAFSHAACQDWKCVW